MKKRYTFKAVTGQEGFANEYRDDGMIGRIRMPYGEYPYGEVTCPDGRRRRIVQLWDEASARAVRDGMPKEGYPVYQGHPDVPDVAAKYPNKAAIGWVTGVELANGAALLDVDWIDNPGRGFKWFSPYWNCETDEEPKGDGALVHVSSLLSVGLVNNPNIPEFTLFNEWGAENAAPTKAEEQVNNSKEQEAMDLAQLIAALGLPEGTTFEQALAEITKLQQAAVAASDNADAQVAAAQAEAQDAVAAEQERTKAAEQDFANEREARIGLLLDNAIAGGNITPAMKKAWHDRLVLDIDAGSTALFNERAVKTKPEVNATAANENVRKKTLVELANERMSENGRLDYTTAFLQVKAEHPELCGGK